MPRVANYEFFSDVSFGLRIGGDIDRTLTQNIQNTPASGEGAVLFWKAWRTGSGSVTYQVFVNGELVSTPTVSQGDFTTLHENLGTSQIQPGSNEVRFVVESGTGTVRIGDVLILYRHDI